MSELDDFLSATLPRQIEAETAIHNGDVEPRLRMWSRKDPVTLLGAVGSAHSGWDEVGRAFRWVASRFSNCTAYDFELLAAGVSGDFAYTVGYERAHSPWTMARQSHTCCGPHTSTVGKTPNEKSFIARAAV